MNRLTLLVSLSLMPLMFSACSLRTSDQGTSAVEQGNSYIFDSEPVSENTLVEEKPQIASVQEALVEKGYNPGVIDGVMGRKTKTALRGLQTDLGLPVTGNIDAEVLRALGLGENGGAGAIPAIVGTTSNGEEDSLVITEQEEVVAPAKSLEKNSSGSRGIVTQSTYLMQNASIMAESVIEIPQGTTLQLLAKKGSFYKTKYRGRHGYVYDRSIKASDTLK